MSTYQPRAGDIVRVGHGKKLWKVTTRFWADRPGSQITTTNDPRAQAVSLDPIEGYTTSSAMVERLSLVERPQPALESAARCAEGGGLDGDHGFVHTRYGNGAGGNRPCSGSQAKHRATDRKGPS